jgi:hypothetical protein
VREAFTCYEAQAAAVKETGHQAGHPVQMREDPVHFIAGQNHGKALGLCRPLHSLQPADLFLEHLLVESRAARVAASQTGRPRGRQSRGAKESKSNALRAWFWVEGATFWRRARSVRMEQ